jgi:hypothetical protein
VTPALAFHASFLWLNSYLNMTFKRTLACIILSKVITHTHTYTLPPPPAFPPHALAPLSQVVEVALVYLKHVSSPKVVGYPLLIGATVANALSFILPAFVPLEFGQSE